MGGLAGFVDDYDLRIGDGVDLLVSAQTLPDDVPLQVVGRKVVGDRVPTVFPDLGLYLAIMVDPPLVGTVELSETVPYFLYVLLQVEGDYIQVRLQSLVELELVQDELSEAETLQLQVPVEGYCPGALVFVAPFPHQRLS